MAKRKSNEGCWVIETPDGDYIVENSEIRALRRAVSSGGNVVFVKFGDTVSNGISPLDEESNSKSSKPDSQSESNAPDSF